MAPFHADSGRYQRQNIQNHRGLPQKQAALNKNQRIPERTIQLQCRPPTL